MKIAEIELDLKNIKLTFSKKEEELKLVE